MRKATLNNIRTMARDAKQALWDASRSVGREPTIFLHWSAGHYGQPFPDYHINIDQDGSVYVPVDDLSEKLAHTWHHNTGAVSVSLLCCAFATTENLGVEPPTQNQIECMAQVIAALAQEFGIPIDYDHVRTHAEQADIDGYGPATTCERWDLWLLPGVEKGQGGNVLRGKANFYQQQN